ncbi:neutral ceramidase [Mycobacterium marinum]|uniref:neutral ceramidase n=1 Tax=Mycobacterium marinum TaxID=1781 RepID=UPI000E3BF81F|nr:neutral ceramidase [Mycobacterium marinum]RFZ40749.1 Neutral ceramidase [Mycobacterium marinum]WCS19212.1 neutral/alkaline ceramidase [Mycobacterium marinum]GJP01205.1 neutral ceramidase [Mycobacterium marinum]
MLSVGRGIADITGEAADCGMLGYGKSDQRTAGIHLRLRSRAFVFRDDSQDENPRLLLVVAELPMPMQNVNDEVLRRLAESYGDTYTEQNTLITTTHTHAGPGGYCGYLMYNLTTNGFRPATFAAIVDGIVESVAHAHDDVAPAEVMLSHGELHSASINRSPSAFDRNPEADKAFFPNRIDPQTTLVRIDRGEHTVGAIHFFATHGTSMTNRNRMISGDNKGFAAYHWERTVGGADYLAGQPDFIAAFAQTNPGDMSPNVDGPLPPGAAPQCALENTRQIGLRQFEDASTQLGATASIGSGIDARLTYVDLSSVRVRGEFTPDGQEHRTGSPTVGAGGMAGTEEGKGFQGFHQGQNLFWDKLSGAMYRLAGALGATQAPKGIVVPAGLPNRVHPFVQEIAPVQLVRIGRLYLIGIPGEPTVVAGLRLRRTVASIVGAELADVLCVGYCNAYIHYLTTPEEYLEQRYEGGSTLFGRWELPAFMQIVAGLAEAMRDGRPIAPGPRPRLARPLSWGRTAPADTGSFGAVIAEPAASYRPGEAVQAAFVSALPSNDLRRGDTYLEVQRREGQDWARVADDGDWSTSFHWERQGRAGSRVSIRWEIPCDTAPGQYRILHHGAARNGVGALTPFTATTREFTVG